jgi:hypothetical protein
LTLTISGERNNFLRDAFCICLPQDYKMNTHNVDLSE